MPERLLYPKPPRAPVDGAEGFEAADDALQRLMSPEGFVHATTEGTGPLLLVVTGAPSRNDASCGRLLSSPSGERFRKLVEEKWRGAVRYVAALQGEGADKASDEKLARSRGMLGHELSAHTPARVLALGGSAAFALLGSRPSPLYNRKTYGWVRSGEGLAPVFPLSEPGAGGPNRFLSQFYREDLLWALAASVPQPSHYGASYLDVQTAEEAQAACAALDNEEGFAFDMEYAGFMWDPDFRSLCLAAVPVGGKGLYLWDEQALKRPETFGPLRALLENPSVRKGGANVKADVSALQQAGVHVRGVEFDVRLERKLLDPEASGYLTDMAWQVGMGGHKAEADIAVDQMAAMVRKLAAARQSGVFQKALQLGGGEHQLDVLGLEPVKYADEPKAIAYALIDTYLLHRYCVLDALATARLSQRLECEIALSPERSRVYNKLVIPAAVAIQKVEAAGVPMDRGAVNLFRQTMVDGMEAALKKVRQYGPNINPGSSQQIGEVLFKRLKLRSTRLTDGGAPSTDDEALTALKDKHPLPGYVLEYRHYQKLCGYSADWLGRIRPDGRVHGSIHLDGARSGRTSMSAPNLQQIPRASDSADGKMARDCIMAPRGMTFVQADFSQQELRVAAYLAQDKVMADLFRSGEDFHEATAKLVSKVAWGISPEEVKKPHRTMAKTINFALCVAEGQLVLTDRGLVPVQSITVNHRVWDGIEWVAHEGVVYKGFKEVVTYDGVTATPDHRVFLESGGTTTIGEALGNTRRLAVGGVEDVPVGYAYPNGAYGKEDTQQEVRRSGLSRVLQEALGAGGQHSRTQDDQLSLSEKVRRRLQSSGSWEKVRGHAAAVQQGYARLLSQLQGAWNKGAFQLPGRVCAVGSGEVAFAGNIQGQGLRQDRQQRALLQGQPAARDENSKPVESALPKAHVYDIVNAGPRHRFTVSGRVVSNCYGKSTKSLAAEMGIPVEQAQAIIDAILGRFKGFARWSQRAIASAKREGGCWTYWEGEKARWRPLWRIGDTSEEGSYARSQARNGALNSPVQGTASEFCIDSITKLVGMCESGQLDAQVVLPVHDSIMLLCPKEKALEVGAAMKRTMEDYPWVTDFVPLKADVEWGPAWGSLEELEGV